jgi:hypothetical protein
LFPQLRKLAYKIVNSSTKNLPAWKEILGDLHMSVALMPRDVSTRWNSTLILLDYALKHRKAVDLITQRRDLGLRKYELMDNEWAIIEQLRDVLEVSEKNAQVARMFFLT